MEALNQKAWLLWLIRVRIVIVTFLLGIELTIILLLNQPWIPKKWFLVTIVLWYGLIVFFALLMTLSADYAMQSYLHIICDICMVTAVIYFTGGVDSYFHLLYPLLVILAAISLPRAGAYLVASLSFILSGAVLELSYFGLIPSYSAPTAQPSVPGFLIDLTARIATNLFGFLAVAYISSSLVENLRRTGTRLEAASGELENLQAFNQNVIDSMAGGLVSTDLESRVLLLNRAGALIFGLSPAAVMGKPLSEVLPEFAGITASPIGLEMRVLTPSGREKHVRVSVSELRGAEESEQGRVYFFQDMTELRRLEREVRLKDRMAALGRMAAAIAHEIRNPLAAIGNSVKLFASMGPLSTDQNSLIGVVVSESQRLDRIVSDFLSYSRERKYEFQPANLNELLQETLALLVNHPNAKRIDFRRRLCREPLVALLDRDAIKQVFWNLGDNAMKAMPDGGTLEVSTRRENQHGVVRFADSGVGVTPVALEKIFEPFQSSFVGGTGIGLAIVYEIISAHQGLVRAEPRPEGGTAFQLELPLASAEQARPAAATRAAGRR
jgi:two-component system sensor histidine kinase PilS (NtrC family)